MTAELFLAALTGGGLLAWAAQRVHSRRKLISWGLATAGCFLVSSQALAAVTGLASGENQSPGWMALILAGIIIYTLAILVVGIGGLLLMRDLHKTAHLP
jgi:ABC-type Co2+ transport system permease subunit